MMEDTYDEKVEYANKYIGLDSTWIAGEDLLTAVSLVNLLTLATRAKSPDVRPLDVLDKLIPTPDAINDKGTIWIKERLSLMCEIFLIPNSKFRSFGLKGQVEIVNEIKRIVDTWLPF